MKGFMKDMVQVDEEISAEELEAFERYLEQFDRMAEHMVQKLEPSRRDALCEQVVAMGIFALSNEEVPVEVAEFISVVFKRCNITFTDARKK